MTFPIHFTLRSNCCESDIASASTSHNAQKKLVSTLELPALKVTSRKDLNTGTFPPLMLQIFRLVLFVTYACLLIHLPAPRYSSPYSCCLSGGKLPQSLLRNAVSTSPFIIPVSVAPGSMILTWTSNVCISRLKESANASTPYLEIV